MAYEYKIYIWQQSSDLPGPTTFEAAGQTMQALKNIQAPANLKFVELVQQLLKHHPSQASDPHCPHSAWGGDPLGDALTGDKKLFCLSLPPANRVELLRLVVDTASARGLTVLDDQIGMVFFPGGAVLPEDRAASWVRIKEQMDSENL
jgi:hypothetical protein